tara:strand:+ start:86627 stop:86929 length:303 start_codon:yes stop_codon:yes gene_type:complete
MKYNSPFEALEETGSFDAYYKQWESVKPEIGPEYYQAKGTWQEMTFKIVYIGNGVALGVCTGAKGMGNYAPIGKKVLFVSEGVKAGWVYEDSRSIYRLQK